VRTIALDIFGFLNSTQEGGMAPPPIILALRDAQVHICTFDGCNKAFYIEISVNESLHLTTTLDIPNIDPYDCHV